jgi:hypothetical protein
VGKRRIKTIICRDDLRRGSPEQALGPLRGIDGGGEIASEEAGLHLPCPVIEFGQGQDGIPRQLALHDRLVEAVMVQATEAGFRSAQRSDQAELGPA